MPIAPQPRNQHPATTGQPPAAIGPGSQHPATAAATEGSLADLTRRRAAELVATTVVRSAAHQGRPLDVSWQINVAGTASGGDMHAASEFDTSTVDDSMAYSAAFAPLDADVLQTASSGVD